MLYLRKNAFPCENACICVTQHILNSVLSVFNKACTHSVMHSCTLQHHFNFLTLKINITVLSIMIQMLDTLVKLWKNRYLEVTRQVTKFFLKLRRVDSSAKFQVEYWKFTPCCKRKVNKILNRKYFCLDFVEEITYALEHLILCGEESFQSTKKIVLSLFTVLKKLNVTKEMKLSGTEEFSTIEVKNTHH